LLVIALFSVGLWLSVPSFLSGKQPGIALQEMDKTVIQIENLLQQQTQVESVFTQMGGFIFGRSQYEVSHPIKN